MAYGYGEWVRGMMDGYLDAADWTDLVEDMAETEERRAMLRDCRGWAPDAFDAAREAVVEFLGSGTSEDDTWRRVRAGGWTPEQAGHDLWLTRNGHGTGFWDRGRGAHGDALAATAGMMGEQHAYVGDDMMAHLG